MLLTQTIPNKGRGGQQSVGAIYNQRQIIGLAFSVNKLKSKHNGFG